MTRLLLGTKTTVRPHGAPYKTEKEMTDICCEPTAALQCKEEIVGTWNGYSVEEFLNFHGITLDAEGRDQNGRRVKVKTRERDIPCGKIVNRYIVKQQNCCDGVTELSWDAVNSGRSVSPGSRVAVSVLGGRLPFTVRVRGNGFSLDGYSLRTGTVNGRSFWVYASPQACGPCPITVDDGCTTTAGTVYSTVGEWLPVTELFFPHCLVDWRDFGLFPCSAYQGDIIRTFSVTSGRYSLSATGEQTRDIGFLRISNGCGHWAAVGGSDVYYVAHPAMPGLAIPALIASGTFSCDGVSATIYNFCQRVIGYGFVC